jgi:ankyrin repeat protein
MATHKSVILPALLLALGISQAAEPEANDRFYQAIRNNDLASLKALINSADLNAGDRRGATPLMYAAAFGSIEELKLLLDAGADLNAKNSFNATALICAAGDPVKSRMLIEHGADVNVQSQQGRTPLMVAASRDGNAGLVRLVLAKGGDVRAKGAQGGTALLLASQMGDIEIMRLLIEKGADANAAPASLGLTPLADAISSNHDEAVRLLLASGANVNATITADARVRNGRLALKDLTTLMLAAPYGSPAMIEILLKAGADVNAKEARGVNALMLAVASETQDMKVVERLLKAGADVNARSAAGETALDWANRFGSRPVIALLRSAGAREGAPLVTPAAPNPAGSRDARKALENSIDLLQRSSTEFFRESGCVACHHQSVTAMAVRAARSIGLRVDEDAAREQLKVMASQAAGSQVRVLQGIAAGSRDIELTLLQGLRESGYSPEAVTDALVADLAPLQHLDGSWHRGPPVNSRAPIEEGDISRTVEAVRALQVYGFPGRQTELESRIARARGWLLEAKPRTTDDQAMLLLGLSLTDADKQKIRRVAHSLMALQRSDGGWPGNPNLSSDAFATGEAL